MIDEKQNDNELILILQKRAKYFLDTQEFIHLSLKTGKFYNGTINKVGEDYLVVRDRVVGEVPVFFIELTYNGIEKYQME